MVKNKKAFSLIEVMISMIIIMVISMGMIPVLTKAKPKLANYGLRGQYGCWYEAGKLYEWYFDERTPRTSTPQEVPLCRLQLDQRPANFYILAAGAGGTVIPGKVVSIYTPAISNHMNIELGLYNSTITDTVVGDNAEVVAGGVSTSLDAYNGIIPDNIKSCKITKGNACSTTCEVIEQVDIANGDTSYAIRINGCDEIDEYGNPNNKIIKFNELNYIGRSGSLNFNNVPEATMNMYSAANSYHYEADGLEFNFEFIDSSYIATDKLLGFTSNLSSGYNTQTNSKMSSIVKSMSIRRKSRLTELMSNLNAGAPQKNGAVLILW